MTLFLQATLNGIVLGGIYSLAAVGFSLIFGVMGIVNLTHGVFVVGGAYAAFALWRGLGLDPLLALLPIGLVFFAFGYVYQRTIIHWAVTRASIVASLLATFGVALVLRNLMQIAFSPDIRTITPAYSFSSIGVGPLQIDLVRVVALGASLVLLLLLALALARTPFGRAIRATAQQPLAAELSGLNVRHVYGLTFGIAAGFAAASGGIVGIVQPFSPATEAVWTLNAFIVVVLGGVGSPSGALLGGLLLGLISSYTAQYVGPAFTNAMMFMVLVVMLLVRPHGILGNPFGESR